MSSYVGSRFGQDTAPRIATTAAALMEASELAPLPTYQPIIPFYPSIIDGSGSTSGGPAAALAAASSLTGDVEWKQYPDRFNLYVYQGDDVQIPLYFQNPAEPDTDMSDEAGWAWKAQTRKYHRYYAYKTFDFVISSEYTPPDPEDPESIGTTLVTLYIPRFSNRYTGVYSWDLQSTSPFEGPDYPEPPPFHDGIWPLTDMVRTWLYGYLYVVPRVTSTDYLPLPPNAYPNGTPILLTPMGYTVGPNGRVP